jgi:hypothetical protein
MAYPTSYQAARVLTKILEVCTEETIDAYNFFRDAKDNEKDGDKPVLYLRPGIEQYEMDGHYYGQAWRPDINNFFYHYRIELERIRRVCQKWLHACDIDITNVFIPTFVALGMNREDTHKEIERITDATPTQVIRQLLEHVEYLIKNTNNLPLIQTQIQYEEYTIKMREPILFIIRNMPIVFTFLASDLFQPPAWFSMTTFQPKQPNGVKAYMKSSLVWNEVLPVLYSLFIFNIQRIEGDLGRLTVNYSVPIGSKRMKSQVPAIPVNVLSRVMAYTHPIADMSIHSADDKSDIKLAIDRLNYMEEYLMQYKLINPRSVQTRRDRQDGVWTIPVEEEEEEITTQATPAVIPYDIARDRQNLYNRFMSERNRINSRTTFPTIPDHVVDYYKHKKSIDKNFGS